MCECVLAASATSSLLGYCFVTNRAIARVVCGENGQGFPVGKHSTTCIYILRDLALLRHDTRSSPKVTLDGL